MALESLFTNAQTLFTLFSFLTFVGIVVWAYGKRSQPSFDQAAMLPFADEEINSDGAGEKHHG